MSAKLIAKKESVPSKAAKKKGGGSKFPKKAAAPSRGAIYNAMTAKMPAPNC
jgi:hypothetical protein